MQSAGSRFTSKEKLLELAQLRWSYGDYLGMWEMLFVWAATD